MCGNYDITLFHLARVHQPFNRPTRAVCHALLRAHADRMLIQCLESDAVTNLGLQVLANEQIFSIPDGQAKYWVEYDEHWDYRTLTYDNWQAFYDKTVEIMEPGPTATDNPKSISAFRDRGGKLVMWHGWADQIIMCGMRQIRHHFGPLSAHFSAPPRPSTRRVPCRHEYGPFSAHFPVPPRPPTRRVPCSTW